MQINAGAGLFVAVCGEIRTMPGLPRYLATETIRINENGEIDGLL